MATRAGLALSVCGGLAPPSAARRALRRLLGPARPRIVVRASESALRGRGLSQAFCLEDDHCGHGHCSWPGWHLQVVPAAVRLLAGWRGRLTQTAPARQ